MQGLGAAAPRVIAVAIVRDRYAGRQMARVMSFAMAVFIIIPVLAPRWARGCCTSALGGSMFDLMLIAGIIVARVGRTAPARDRAQQRPRPLPLAGRLAQLALETPQTIGYAVSGGFMFGCVLGYVSSAQQVFVDVFDLGADFPLAFGAIGTR